MELALYHPEHGYYRRARDPFGRAGDYFTASQLQPVYGILMASLVEELFKKLNAPEGFTVVELGAGRGEMSQAFAAWSYVPLEIGSGALPQQFTGVVFANEFFDALPVDQVVLRRGVWRVRRVDWRAGRFIWIEAEPAEGRIADYVRRFVPLEEEGSLAEVHLEALAWLERVAHSLQRGFLLAIDYGYTAQEQRRFPQGTLMSYRRHQACEDVLAQPGDRDITAQVPFTALQQHGACCGLRTERLERLARVLLEIGERDRFSAALSASGGTAALQRRLQLKTLLVSLGESFRVLLLRKGEAGRRESAQEKGPERIGA